MWELYLLAVSPATSTGPNMSKSEAAPRSLAHFLRQVINSMPMRILTHQGLLFTQPLEGVSQEVQGLYQDPHQDQLHLRLHSMCNFLNTRAQGPSAMGPHHASFSVCTEAFDVFFWSILNGNCRKFVIQRVRGAGEKLKWQSMILAEYTFPSHKLC